MIEIIPSILAQTKEEFEAKVRKFEPYFKRAHLDVADGVFVPNTTVSGYDEIKAIETPLVYDVHFMVQRPQDIIDPWRDVKQAERFFIHIESDAELRSLIQGIQSNGKEVGLVINPETSIDELFQYMDIVKHVQFMTVHPGFSGRTFEDSVLDKISSFRENYPSVTVLVDGGINAETAPRAIAAGATVLVSGTALMSAGDIEQEIKHLKGDEI